MTAGFPLPDRPLELVVDETHAMRPVMPRTPTEARVSRSHGGGASNLARAQSQVAHARRCPPGGDRTH
jgi:hypothetical protein